MDEMKNTDKYKPMDTLDQWSVIGSGPYTSPECSYVRINGIRGSDGKSVLTSPVVWGKKFLIETMNTMYTLLTPNPKYKEFCEEYSIPVEFRMLGPGDLPTPYTPKKFPEDS